MGIVTRTGDDGLTGLWSGERVRKDDMRVEAYGTIDELDSLLGEAKHWLKRPDVREIAEEVQRDLYRVAGELATRTGSFSSPITAADEDRLSVYVERLEAEVPLKGFVIPGATIQSAKLDVARTVCRRAERRIVSLAWDADVPGPLRRYVNRLSDLLFMLARAEEASEGGVRYAKPEAKP
ncbi:MAG: cob(I)yrinic acid a,c-diamide adenosyltransferase [Spirochaetes bacterium]|nr:cob(I)yrinic acid a,c-diamide adenosyltransferase [Spirochaetota bacterium]MBU1081034.1 cob(I)yrinic acid a,c-diamide adenosyltransferase [Spirochaetota bacterium]